MPETKCETFQDYLSEARSDAKFRQAWEASEAAYEAARLRIMRGLTQAQLATLVGTQQGQRIRRIERI
ncbi:MAG: hypothetical protein ACPGWR_23880 [Ardenticatenaceae bacterium]